MQSPLGANLREPGIGLCRQFARCNALVNKDKSDYYSKLISDNSHDSRKLWRELHKTLNRVSDVTLPFHESEKSLADQYASLFQTKLRKLEILSLPLAPSFRSFKNYCL